MRGVAGRGNAGEADDARARDPHVALRNRCQLAPELVECVSVEPTCARLEPGGIDDVRGADRGDMDGERRVLAHERPGGARVIEVDVREEEVLQVADLRAARAERVAKRREAARRTAVEEREPVVRLDEVRGDPVGVPAVQEVERLVRHRRDATAGDEFRSDARSNL